MSSGSGEGLPALWYGIRPFVLGGLAVLAFIALLAVMWGVDVLDHKVHDPAPETPAATAPAVTAPTQHAPITTLVGPGTLDVSGVATVSVDGAPVVKVDGRESFPVKSIAIVTIESGSIIFVGQK